MVRKAIEIGLGILLGAIITGHVKAESLTITADQIKRVYDGDSIYINIPDLPAVFGRNIGVRIAGIDTPEMHSRCVGTPARAREKDLAEKSKSALTSKLQAAKVIELTELKRDKYFRLLATVKLDGKDVAKSMIAEGYALPYDGGKKKGWCK